MKQVKRNLPFFILFLGLIYVYVTRYNYLPTQVVTHPDSHIEFSTQDAVLEQTWQPDVKMLAGISIPYYVSDGFTSDVQLKVYTDDYETVIVQSIKEGYIFNEEENGRMEFLFDNTVCIPGERYRMQISLLNFNEAGLLQIQSGSNYAGCTVAEKEEGQAAAMEITFVKYSKLFWIVSVLLPFFAISLLLMLGFNRKFEDTIGMSVFLEAIILYCFGLFEQLILGINVIYILAIVSIIVSMLIYNYKGMILKELLSSGLFIYLLFFIVIIITSQNDWLGNRDELRHWGIAVKDMFYYNAFAKHINTTVILPRYLPLAAIIEYVFIYMNGLYNEGILLIAYQTMILSTLIILCKPMNKRTIKKLFLPTMVGLICIPIIFFPYVSSTIMVDSLLAAMIVYALVSYFSNKLDVFNGIRIALTLAAMALTKDMGLVFAGLTAFIIFADIVVKQIIEKKLQIEKVLFPIGCLGIVLMSYFSWQVYLSIPTTNIEETVIINYEESTASDLVAFVSGDLEEIAAGFEEAVISDKERVLNQEQKSVANSAISASGISISGLLDVLSGNGEPYQYESYRVFVTSIFDINIFDFGPLSFSVMDLIILLSFSLFSLGYFGFWKETSVEKNILAITIILSSLLLCFFLQITYWFTFSRKEAVIATAYNRYLAPFICAIMIILFYFIYMENSKNHDNKYTNFLVLALSVFFIISTPIEGIITETNEIKDNATEDMVYGHDMLAEILRSISAKGEKVYFICNNSDGYTKYLFNKEVCPLTSSNGKWNIAATDEGVAKQYELYGEEVNTSSFTAVSADEWESNLEQCQYVVLFHVDDIFKESYADLFEKPDTMGDGCVYRVVQNQGQLLLQFIGQTGIKDYR